ncbi:ABC transporter permease [uncultured Algimonas sp.]|uniref:ABC transporter permease n=1 Tax=uncultured Algimonas sp. TaxID=1547920 RepID=UPI00262AF36D|nr:ABC transporter permease [uncultured Algimonas sp.]
MRHDLDGPLAPVAQGPPPFELIVHNRYNEEAITQYNIVPGLLGVILTMTLVMITGMALTKEGERGTLENLLAMPAKPLEVMIGKIIPYLGIGIVQTAVILIAARLLFGVPFVGSFALLSLGIAIFVIANLSLGFTFSTIAKSQMQAMQLTFFFFLPSLLLSGFMFPFLGMPKWAQMIGELLPLTHFLRVVRGVMLKGVRISEVQTSLLAMCTFILVVGVVAMFRYRQTLDYADATPLPCRLTDRPVWLRVLAETRPCPGSSCDPDDRMVALHASLGCTGWGERTKRLGRFLRRAARRPHPGRARLRPRPHRCPRAHRRSARPGPGGPGAVLAATLRGQQCPRPASV